MRLLITIAILFTQWTAANVRGEESEVDLENVDLVLQGITDLTFLRDDVVQRYVLMVTGETHQLWDETTKRAPLTTNRVYKLQAVDKKKDFRYKALGQVVGPEGSNKGFDHQHWVEMYQCGLELKGRNGTAGRTGYIVKEKGQSTKDFMEQNRTSAGGFDPFDDLVLHAMFLTNRMEQQGWIEQVYLVESKLLSAETITQGDIRSKWRWKHHTLEFEIELTQSKAFDYMPAHVKYTSQSKGMPKLFSEMEIKWKKHAASGKLLPHIIKAAAGSPYGNSEEHHHWVLDWRLGSEIPADFFDCNSEDFRLKFSPLYELDFDVYVPGGLITGTPWKTPQEILPEDKRSETSVK